MSNKIGCSFLVSVFAFGIASLATGQSPSAPIRYAFTVSWSRERVLQKKVGRDSTVQAITTNTYVGHVKVTNRTSVPLQNLEVHIQTHYKAMNGKAQTDEHKDSVKTIPLIRSNETVTVDTDHLELKSSELKGGYLYTDGSPSRQTDSIRGAIVRLHHEGKQVFEYISNPALKSLGADASSKK